MQCDVQLRAWRKRAHDTIEGARLILASLASEIIGVQRGFIRIELLLLWFVPGSAEDDVRACQVNTVHDTRFLYVCCLQKTFFAIVGISIMRFGRSYGILPTNYRDTKL
jgi:hypothetical protein